MMLNEYASIPQAEHAYVPFYVQPLVCTCDNIALTQRPDNFFILRWVVGELSITRHRR